MGGWDAFGGCREWGRGRAPPAQAIGLEIACRALVNHPDASEPGSTGKAVGSGDHGLQRA
jgi:hypothetical protein